jgi:predicted negative regulator of RcsB-dependent stress response
VSDEDENLSRRERRAQAKTGKSKDGANEDVKDRNQRLRAEAAAKRRRLREAERVSAADEGLDAGERVDDALVRSADAGVRFLRDNFAWLQWIVIAGAAGAMGFLIFEYRQGVKAEKQGAQLASILGNQFGRIASADPENPSDARLVDPRTEFASEEERHKKAAEAWTKLGGAKSGYLKVAGKLGRAGVLYDQGKFGEARAAYEKTLADGKIALHTQLKGRAMEGIGFCFEAEKKYPEAKKAFAKSPSTPSFLTERVPKAPRITSAQLSAIY